MKFLKCLLCIILVFSIGSLLILNPSFGKAVGEIDLRLMEICGLGVIVSGLFLAFKELIRKCKKNKSCKSKTRG